MNIEHINKDDLNITFIYELVVVGHQEKLRIYEEINNFEYLPFPFKHAANHVLRFLKYKPDLIEVVFLNGNSLTIKSDDI
ncbi:hypothetical protein G6355_11085 [Vibrio cholerae]|uniref:hypothetical protein n=1 Tax=Vibrio cholerae TaxID=666 RepID=UPI002F2D5CA8|nr:hypothetical protein [Vibrio cholerae]